MKTFALFLILCCSMPILQYAQNDVCNHPSEVELIAAIQAYRTSNGLPEIPVSKSLTHVAQLHATDLAENNPDQNGCNMHSWSDQGDWSPCCYTPDHKNAQCMWDKPKELTTYPGYGFEISAAGARDAEEFLELWKGSNGHNSVILNEGMWEDMPWQAMGVGMDGNYAVIWFGVEKDPEGGPFHCRD